MTKTSLWPKINEAQMLISTAPESKNEKRKTMKNSVRSNKKWENNNSERTWDGD
jgi:hypothetical protein